MTKAFLFVLISLLIARNTDSKPDSQEQSLSAIFDSFEKRMQVCDNMIVNDIEGGKATVLAAGKEYLRSMQNFSTFVLPSFENKWKFEMKRVQGPKINECKHLKIFGDEKKNYDEAKRFCFFPGAKHANSDKCVIYSIGSNDKWDFEENAYKDSDCTIETFDCTINATIPKTIRDRTRYHLVCLGSEQAEVESDGKILKYMKLSQLNQLVGRKEGPDYLKMDIEVRCSVIVYSSI